eukprot:790677_1
MLAAVDIRNDCIQCVIIICNLCIGWKVAHDVYIAESLNAEYQDDNAVVQDMSVDTHVVKPSTHHNSDSKTYHGEYYKAFVDTLRMVLDNSFDKLTQNPSSSWK